jgi:hypothetical protein
MSPLPTASALPPTMAVRDMLLDMLGRDVTVAPSEPWAPTLSDPGAVAAYIDDESRLRALISCDLELAVALGSSIALIPAKTAANSVEEGRMTPDMADNLSEVLNIFSALFNRPSWPHVRLYLVYLPGEPPPADLSAQARLLGKREDLKIEVSGYGSGRLSLVIV